MNRGLPTLLSLLSILGVATADHGVRAADAEGLRQGLVAHWKFDGDAKDSSGKGADGRAHGVDFSAVDRHGRPNSAARFDGIDDCIEVAHSQTLSFGNRPFTIAAWVHIADERDDVVGDLVGKFDERTRTGLNLCIKSSSPSYNSHGDARNVHFGIDNGIDGPWEDCGKLWPSNTYVSSLVVYRGAMYAGLADAADPREACHVFRYNGGAEWIDCGRVGPNPKTRSVYSMIVHKGSIFAGTGQYDWQTVNPENCDVSRVYRYAGGTEWVDCGQPGENYRVLSLASYKGELYVGTDVTGGAPRGPTTGKVYRYAGGTEWVDCGRLGAQQHVFALTVHNGHLYGGTAGEVYRYEGDADWTYIGKPLGNTQIHSLEVHKGKLFAGTWPHGKVCRYEGGVQWTDCGELGVATDRYQINEVNALTVYNGMLYAGAIPKAEVYRYRGYSDWERMRQLVPSDAYAADDISSWNRVPCLTVFGGMLYAGTGSCRGYADEAALPQHGRVYRTNAGRSVTYDDDLGSGWRHLVAVRGSGLKIYIDGKEKTASPPFGYGHVLNIENSLPLTIGFGAVDYFSGAIDDLRIYNRALSNDEIQGLHQPPARSAEGG